MRNSIAFLSDFGDIDPYVGIVKGVIYSIDSNLRVIDLSHKIPFGDVQRAAFILWQSIPFFPDGTIFLAVVDPEVGSQRRGIIVRTSKKTFVGPDNGLFSYVAQKDYQGWEITNSEFYLPHQCLTFHGRDIFGPISAHLAIGISESEIGRPVEDIKKIVPPILRDNGNSVIGEVLHSDHFGNVITSIGCLSVISKTQRVSFSPWINTCNEREFELSKVEICLVNQKVNLQIFPTFMNIPIGKSGAIIGSSGLIEIVVNSGNASDHFSLKKGDLIILQY